MTKDLKETLDETFKLGIRVAMFNGVKILKLAHSGKELEIQLRKLVFEITEEMLDDMYYTK